jgi:hypothetical protein
MTRKSMELVTRVLHYTSYVRRVPGILPHSEVTIKCSIIAAGSTGISVIQKGNSALLEFPSFTGM